MRLLTFQRRSASRRAGLHIRGNRILDISRAYSRIAQEDGKTSAVDTAGLIEALQAISSSLLEIIRSGQQTMVKLRELEQAALDGNLEDCLFAMGETPLVAPIPTPPLLLHFDAHEEHAKAMHSKMCGADAPFPDIWYQYPHYTYGNAYGILGPNEEVLFPDGEEEMDFELEFAAVLAHDVTNVSVKEAENAVLGYTIVNDWTARGLQKKINPLGYGHTMAKNFATSMGPFIVTRDEIDDPYSLRMTVKINDEVVSSGMTHEARYSFGEMISCASDGNTLPAGTIVCSGAFAKGSGAELGRFLKGGDSVELDIQEIGSLRNKVSSKRRPRVYSPRAV